MSSFVEAAATPSRIEKGALASLPSCESSNSCELRLTRLAPAALPHAVVVVVRNRPCANAPKSAALPCVLLTRK